MPMAARWRVPMVLLMSCRVRENARRTEDAILLNDDAAIVDRVVREKDSLDHFRRGFAIDRDAGLYHVLQVGGLLNRNQCADSGFAQSIHRLNHDLDIFPLLTQ